MTEASKLQSSVINNEGYDHRKVHQMNFSKIWLAYFAINLFLKLTIQVNSVTLAHA